VSRWVYLLGVGLALVALALAFTDWALSLQPGVTEANAKRIRLGMTLQEVEALLGSPNYLIPPVTFKVGTLIPRPPDGEWNSDCVRVVVLFDEDGRVEEVTWSPTGKALPSYLARLRAWLGW
jgi:hypothetical protein